MEVTLVYESMFGDTTMAANAFGEGVRQAVPDARVTVVLSPERMPGRRCGSPRRRRPYAPARAVEPVVPGPGA
jgi:hypothetical protein